MKCFFGHSFGKVENGYQYCNKCGLARVPQVPSVPHPCLGGHIWVEDSRLGYSGYTPTLTGGIQWRDFKVAYRCKKCSQTKTDWLFGH